MILKFEWSLYVQADIVILKEHLKLHIRKMLIMQSRICLNQWNQWFSFCVCVWFYPKGSNV